MNRFFESHMATRVHENTHFLNCLWEIMQELWLHHKNYLKIRKNIYKRKKVGH